MSSMRPLAILLCVFMCSVSLAQHYSLDSLRDIYFNFKDEKKYKEGLKFFTQQVHTLPSNEISARYLLVKGFQAEMIGYQGYHDSALKMVRPLKNIPVVTNDDYTEAWADCMYSVGQWYTYINQADSALYFFKLSLNARLDIKEPYLPRLADNYSFLGYIYNNYIGYHEVAEGYYRKEGEILRKSYVPKFKWMKHYLNLATTFSKFDRQKAINMNVKALSYSETSERSQNLKGVILNNIANAYTRMAVVNDSKEESYLFYKKSLAYSKQALEINRKNFPEDMIDIYQSMASTYADLSLPDSAFYTIQKALKICDDLGEEYPQKCAFIFFMKGYYTHQPSMAIPQLREGIKLMIHHSPPNSQDINQAFQVAGRWFEKHGMTDSALIYYARAVVGKWQVDDVLSLPNFGNKIPKSIRIGLSDKAQLLYEVGRRDDSKKHLESSLNHYYLVERVFDRVLKESESEEEQLNEIQAEKWQYDNALKAAYLLYNDFQGDLEHIWHFMEKSKGAVNLYQTAELNATMGNERDRSSLSLKKHLVGETKHLHDLLETETEDQDALRLQLFELNLKIDSLNKLISTKEQVKLNIKADSVITLKDITNHLLESPKEVFLQFHFTDSLLFVLAVAEDQQTVRRFNKEVVLKARGYADQLKKSLEHGVDAHARHYGYQDFTGSALGLYQLLLGDLSLEKYEELIVIPDGFMTGLPLEVLLTHDVEHLNHPDFRNLPYLVKSSRISYGFSASWLIQAKKWEDKLGDRKPSLLALAFADQNENLNQQRAGLPGSLREVETIQAAWSSNFKMLKGKYASEKELKSKVSQYQILHLATHNEIDLENPLKSGIVLRTDNDPENDGILHSYEVYQMDSRAGMVVLSACESGLGKFQSGEGFLGISRAFGQVGTPYIVNSLWKTSDVFSIHLMKEFYGNFINGSGPADALYKAKLKFIEQGDELSAHPSYWSSYILLGNSSNNSRGRNLGTPLVMVLLGGGALLLAGLIVYFKR